ncbi:MAG: ribonuclease J [Clostridia bacterium]|nr:ribonuclease J [Clostridia bacterium]
MANNKSNKKETKTHSKQSKSTSSSSKKRSPAKKRVERVKKPAVPLRIAFLGGINEVGKNITLYECGDDMFIVDCGMLFPEPELLGVDLVIPDFTYIERNADKIRGIVLTHGHEDHIGGLPYLLKTLNVPIYGTKFTLGLLEGKLREHELLRSTSLNVVKPGDTVSLGCFDIEFIRVTHSIPDSVALAIKSPAGVVVQTGDFKIDTTPIDGEVIDLARFGELGNKGVLALLSDSTNAERPGYSMSERKVGETFDRLFSKADDKRIIVATFASNVHRIQQVIDTSVAHKRKVAVSGRSLENSVAVGTELGYLKIPDNTLVSLDMVNRFPPEKVTIITTGSQGEPLSALSRMAFSDHRKIEITPQDCVIISATPIPGNEKMVSKVVNELMKLGAEVVYERIHDIHVSGHACQEEQKLMLSLVKPKYFIPVHGEQKHLRKHAELAQGMGIPEKNVIIGDNGFVVEVKKSGIALVNTVPAGRVLVDGYGVGDVGSVVLRDRKHLAQDGIIVVVATVDQESGVVVAGPEVISRGFVYVKEAEHLIEDARRLASRILESYIGGGYSDRNVMKNRIKDEVAKMMYERTKRSPMVLPIIMDI